MLVGRPFMRAFTGVLAALGTPMTASGEIDEPGLRRLTRRILDSGMQGVLVNGSMGGFVWLSDEQQAQAVSIVVSEVSGGALVLAGVGETGTQRALRKVQTFGGMGVDAVVVLPPFFLTPDPIGIRDFFSVLAAETAVPLLIYDNPGRVHCSVTPDILIELHQQYPAVVGVKESNQDCGNLQAVLEAAAPHEQFSVLTGSETLMLVGLQMGCHGSIGGLHNLCPGLAVECYRAFREGRLEAAREAQRRMNHIAQVFQYGAIWGGFDEALRYLGVCEQASAQPYRRELSDVERAQVRRILREGLGDG